MTSLWIEIRTNFEWNLYVNAYVSRTRFINYCDSLLFVVWEFVQTQQEWSLGSPLPQLFKWFWLVA